MTLTMAGLLLGAALGLGLNLIWRRLPTNRRHGLADRVLPYLVDQARPSGLLVNRRPLSHVPSVFVPLLASGGAVIDRVIGDGPTVRRRLLRAGQAPERVPLARSTGSVD